MSWLALTVFLGLSFLAGQWLAWRELAASGFYVATSPSSSFVYLLTGMHGIHLLGGVFALLAAGAAPSAAPSAEFTAGDCGRDRLVLAFHGALVGLHFVFAGVCTLNQRRSRAQRGHVTPGGQTHG